MKLERPKIHPAWQNTWKTLADDASYRMAKHQAIRKIFLETEKLFRDVYEKEVSFRKLLLRFPRIPTLQYTMKAGCMPENITIVWKAALPHKWLIAVIRHWRIQ